MCNKMTFSALKVTFRIVKTTFSRLKTTFSGNRETNTEILVYLRNALGFAALLAKNSSN